MAIIDSKKTSIKDRINPSFVIKKVAEYCLPHMLLAVLIPFFLVILSIMLCFLDLISIAEIIVNYIAFPISIFSALIITLKGIYALKGAFPRNTKDENIVIISVLSCILISYLLLINLFHISCYLLGVFPLNFSGAIYIRDMFYSSPSALILFYVAIFSLLITITNMTLTSFFMGYKRGGRFCLSYSCIKFVLMYVILLILFILCYFFATFLDIITLEKIQIQNSIFNSAILCSFVTFILVSLPYNIAQYFLLKHNLIKKEMHHK